MAQLIRTQNLIRTFKVGARDVHALRGIDLTVEQGEFITLRGRSGSGKTTLLNCIAGLDRPTSGSVWIRGQDVARFSEQQWVNLRRKQFGFIFQSFALMTSYSAAENVDLMLRLAGVGGKQRHERTREVLSLVGLTKWSSHRPFEMSGGQQQRVAIARAIASRPSLILADEPTGELDTTTGQQILALLRRIVDRENSTLLIATHDLSVDAYADRVYHLQDGKIANVQVIDATMGE